jgi:hypothetical protein
VTTPHREPSSGAPVPAGSAAGPQPTPPKEPFAYVSQERGLLTLKIREPAAMAVFFLVFIGAGIVFFLLCKQGADRGDQGALAVGYLILAIFGGLGLIGFGIAVRRWRWKQEYIRVMGRSPWA